MGEINVTDLPVSPAILSRLQARATREGISPDDLLSRLLAEDDAESPCDRRKHVGSELSYLTEARLRSLVEAQTTWVVRTDTRGRFTYVNPAWNKSFDQTLDLDAGVMYDQTTIPEDRDAAAAAGLACLRSPNQPVQVMLRKFAADGRLLWTLWDFSAIQNEAGEVTEIQCIGIDITEQREAEQAKLEQERLRASLKTEREFYATVKKTVFALEHDVRTSLGAIATAKTMLAQYYEQLSESRRSEKFAAIDHQLQHVTELLDEMKCTVKGNLSANTFNPTPVNLASLCSLCVSEIQETVGAHLRMRFTNHHHLTSAVVDEVLITRVLLNLLANAAKYSPPGSDVCLELSHDSDWIIFEVIDHGIGIAEEDLDRIFDPFFRTAAVANISGTGLGLSIVKDCVERHQGRISVRSRIGAGATFTVKVPLSPGRVEPTGTLQAAH
ncbi:MAG: PAS domain S-box protein [Chloroflexi bacterium]|nr:PAS domain S-box protein [Chloroflexota bacterium]